MARPCKYDKEKHPDWAWALAIKGLTNPEIAKAMGVATSTFNKWRTENPEFEEAVSNGKDIADSKVEKSLYTRATGYTYEERKVITDIDPKTGETKPVRIEKTTRVVPPDTTAQIFWLKNRRPQDWRDRKDIEMASESDIVFNVMKASEKKEG